MVNVGQTLPYLPEPSAVTAAAAEANAEVHTAQIDYNHVQSYMYYLFSNTDFGVVP